MFLTVELERFLVSSTKTAVVVMWKVRSPQLSANWIVLCDGYFYVCFYHNGILSFCCKRCYSGACKLNYLLLTPELTIISFE
jgi:hypothetical protein